MTDMHHHTKFGGDQSKTEDLYKVHPVTHTHTHTHKQTHKMEIIYADFEYFQGGSRSVCLFMILAV